MHETVICVSCGRRQKVAHHDWLLIRDWLEEHGWRGLNNQWLCRICDEKGASLEPGQSRQKLCVQCHVRPTPTNKHRYCSYECQQAAQAATANKTPIVTR